MSLRSAVALQAGADEGVLASADGDRRAGLPRQQRTALELADLFLSSPSVPGEELQERLREDLSADEVVELLLRLLHYSSNRIRVALRLDDEDAAPTTFTPGGGAQRPAEVPDTAGADEGRAPDGTRDP